MLYNVNPKSGMYHMYYGRGFAYNQWVDVEVITPNLQINLKTITKVEYM